MNDGRKRSSSVPEEDPEQAEAPRGRTQSKPRINRLKRSPRHKADSAPTAAAHTGGARRRTAVFKSVDISDIVNRIAPKNKRPEEAESSLLQWIGDTAVPCTPEIRDRRTKPKLTRQNRVDDLLKLAKQFDFNMIQQEEAHHLQPNPETSAQPMPEDQDLFFDQNNPPASPQAPSEPERPPLGLENTKTTGDDPLDHGQEIEDDLDLLFEGSTQPVSGGLSQGFSSRSQDTAKFAPQFGGNLGSRARADACGATRVGRASELSTVKQVGVADDFDDWNNDDLLDDALVMEMTQNPELFSAPQCSSTQKEMNKSNTRMVYRQNGGDEAKSGEAPRLNQRLESLQRGPNWNKATGNENAGQTGFHAKNNPETWVCPSRKVPGTRSVSRTNSQCKKPMEIQQPLASTSASSMWKVQSTITTSLVSKSRSVSSTTPTFMNTKVTEEKENYPNMEDDVLGDLAAEDLDSIFASDDIWDDGADDDDLFCEACEKMEGSMTEPEPPPKASISNPTPQSSRVQSRQSTTGKRESVFAHPSPSNAQIYDRRATGNQASSSTEVLPGARSAKNNASALDKSMMTSSDRTYKFSHAKSTTGTGSANYSAAGQVCESTMATTVQSYQRIQGDHRLKKPYSTFNAVPAGSKGVSKSVVTRCSDAEIERKKQQAMERRRLRMLANQNLRAPV
ncbi:ewing's tumor-associated antigen 1 isoform X2 [Neoarius graeffei]|uniref:ewing's tumor-associated antigen 1 isoform X2 n=1 Tax=Neoarius graeffei TaxID=443677 RepID=UPI00298D2D12|nr:ewing's tumor-associated antigen 1 isoform X2 [Neoarius graeffei]